MNVDLQHIASLRREYTQGGLRRRDLPGQPLMLFELWLRQAYEAQLPDPTAMCVATVDKQAQPYQRMVLLKYVDARGMVFFTNLGSRKAEQIAYNPRVSLLFPWNMLERQVLVLGRVEKLPQSEVMTYFYSRPRDSQIAALASHQSTILASRAVLIGRFKKLKQDLKQSEIPLPSFWGGFRVRIETMEFWQGGEHRLHDRFLYQRENESWNIDRLAP